MQISLFVAILDIKYWKEAPIGALAPKNDKNFIQDIAIYGDRSVAAVADRAMHEHQWYLSDDLTKEWTRGRSRHRSGHEDTIGTEEQLTTTSGEESQPAGVYLRNGPIVEPHQRSSGRAELHRRRSGDLAIQSSYQLVQMRVATLRVTNDVAERGIALVKRFLGQQTKSEEQTQFLLKTVPLHTRAVPKEHKGAAEDQGGQERLSQLKRR